MNTFEVTYEVEGEVRSVTLTAETPSDAARRFREQNREKNAVIFCVVRQ